MKKEEALQIIKQVIHTSIKAGIFTKIEDAVQVSNAFNYIAIELTKENDTQ
jgi:hypothetical protein